MPNTLRHDLASVFRRKAETIAVIQAHSFLEMLTDAAQSHTEDALWD
jgi:hypothetical protein